MNIRKVLRTAIPSTLIALLLAVVVVANIMIPPNMNMINAALGDSSKTTIKQPSTYTEALDLQYNKSDYTAEEMKVAEQALNEEIVGEGVILLKNDDNAMPFDKGTTFSFFGRSSLKWIGNPMYDMMMAMGYPADPGTTLRTCFQDRGFGVNETLWNFYDTGKGKDYGLGLGSISYGDDEDFSINECPVDVLQTESGLLESAEGTVPVFVWGRKVGEGRDMPRSMYNHTDIAADKTKSYLQPDSVELAILDYLNQNFEDVVLLVNSSAAMELGWVEQFENINSVVYIPSAGNFGMYALADIFSGDINPSGRTVDTYAVNAMSAPAAQNYGDYQYYDELGQPTKYHYTSYLEGIYVGYKYYETRYEDVVMSQGNAGGYSYADEVTYPFGYGLSYTSFDWSGFKTTWSGDTCTVTVDVKNSGDVAGKEVVQVYLQSPYTDYDRANQIEKAAVQLTGFAKSGLLQPGQTESVTVTFDKEQLKVYDANNAKTYILDAGDYYITAAPNAHAATNNVLAAKGFTVENGMTEAGNATMTAVYNPGIPTADPVTYATQSSTGVAITNQFDFADGGHTYLTRSDWQGTWPAHDGEVGNVISTWGNEINGTDSSGNPAAYLYQKTISAADLTLLDGTDSLTPVDRATISDTPVYNAKNGIKLIDLRGKDHDDPLWNDLLDNLAPEDYQTVITTSGYGTAEIKSIGKSFAMDMDSPVGILMGGTGVAYSGSIVLAQTWNQDLAERYGEMIGNQSLIGGCVGWYAPAMNIHRLPFSGRNNEYYSEDPFLSGITAAATSRGAASKGMYTFIKHFALNDQENHRGDRTGQFGLVTWSNEQAIRELYLKPFEMCVVNDPVTLNYVEEDGNGGYQNASREIAPVNAIMTAFNRIGYTWTGGAYPLITSVLREEWGFEGFAITDAAHTGTFMDAYQMLESGADAKLTNVDGARWTFDQNDPAHYRYGRQAMHNILYTVANSKLMSGLMPGSEFVTPMSAAQKVLISVDIVAALLIAGLVWFIVRGFRKNKKATQTK